MAFEAFFLPAGREQRFCILHGAESGIPVRGALVYVHPFAEEMNKARRMAALQARAMAAAGYAVLQIDLYGCGDSAGDCRLAEACASSWPRAWTRHTLAQPDTHQAARGEKIAI